MLSDELDEQLLNGDDQNDDLAGFFKGLTDPAAPAAGVATFDKFVEVFAGGIDGLGPRRSARSASSPAWTPTSSPQRRSATWAPTTAIAGDISFADYARQHTAGWWTNKRMPAKANHIQQAILCRKGRSMIPTPSRLAVCPHWGYIAIDDIYTGARKGERRYVLSVLVGDLILVQPDAYKQVLFRVSAC